MPIPKPRKGESRKDFFDRCMGDSVMVKDFPEAEQRGGVCSTAFEKKNNKKEAVIITEEDLLKEFRDVDSLRAQKKNMTGPIITSGYVQEIKPTTFNYVSNFVANFSVRTAEKDGKTHLVVPIVALIEGVHCGSGGCAFYSASEISRTAQDWNGVPLTASHPTVNGELVQIEQALKDFKIGTFENVRYEAGKLKGEGWIDIQLAQAVCPECLERIRNGFRMEVSTGLLTHSDRNEGIWNGEKFEETLFDFLPDHLALLPNEEGACSIADGCGVIMNTKKECVFCKLNIKGGEKNVNKFLIDGMQSIADLKKHGYWVNELSHSKVREKLSKVINDMDKPGVVHFLRETFNDHFIFEKIVELENSSGLFRQDFSINKKDEIKIKGEAVEVDEQITFPVKVNKEGKNMANSLEHINALIANDKFPQFTKADAEWFKKMDVKHFEKLHALNDCKCTEALEQELVAANDKDVLNVAQIKKLTDELTANESKSKEKENHIPTFEELLEKAKPGMREAIEDGITANQAKRSKLIDALVANERCSISKDRLETKKIGELEELVALGNIPVDHSLKGNGGEKVYGPNEKQPNGYGIPLVPRMDEWHKTK